MQMTSGQLRHYGYKIYGNQWQTAVAKQLKVSPRLVRYWLAEKYAIPEKYSVLIESRIATGSWDAPDDPTKHTVISKALLELVEDIDRSIHISEVYYRVHKEMDEGKAWEDIDNGFKFEGKVNYRSWLAYMQARLIGSLRSITLCRQYEPLVKTALEMLK
jgi:hypothetical protein